MPLSMHGVCMVCNRLAKRKAGLSGKKGRVVEMQRIWMPRSCLLPSIYLPTIMSSRSVACGLMRVQMSMVNRVLLLLKMEAKEDMRAANITASIRPRKPVQRDGRKEGGRKKKGSEEVEPKRWREWKVGRGGEKCKIKLLFFLRGSHCYESLPFGMIDTTSLG